MKTLPFVDNKQPLYLTRPYHLPIVHQRFTKYALDRRCSPHLQVCFRLQLYPVFQPQFLIKKGYRAEPRLATVGEDKATLTAKLPHKTVATRAGLGWIGKNNLLITRGYGPAVRLVTVLTDAPVTTGQPIGKSVCGRCRHCVEACPAHALTGENWEAGMPREKLFDAFTCRGMARNLSQKLIGEAVSICGLCITACPWTQRYLKNNQ